MFAAQLGRVALLGPVLVALGCAASGPVTPNVVTVTAGDFAFAAPDEIPAGLTTFHLVPAGQFPHHLTLVRLADGRTAQDYVDAVGASMAHPEWATPVGGPNPNELADVANATLMLEPGNYALVCYVPIPEGTPHFARGMFRDLRVTGRAKAAPPPVANVRITLTDYDFLIDRPLEAGEHTFLVETTASQPHELVLFLLEPGMSSQDVLQWIQDPQGPPPAKIAGGIAPLAPGEWNTFTARLERGRYAFICFEPDHADHRPHFMHGMIREFAVS